jgi:hypothetical protein
MTEAAQNPPKRKRRYRRSGLVALKRAVVGSIDPQSKLGLVLADMRLALIADVGGPDSVSEAQRILIEKAIRFNLRAVAGDAFLDRIAFESRMDPRVLAIEKETRAQAEAAVRCLTLLGLERKTRIVDLAQALRARGNTESAAPRPTRAPGGAAALVEAPADHDGDGGGDHA